ncbi:MAG: hypothetical protein ACE5FZ_08820 [Nitrospiria bacterium]
MSTIRFEKLGGQVYPAYLVVNDYSIALDPDTIHSLLETAKERPTPFLENLVQKVGTNRYLKELIEEGISMGGKASELAKRLQQELSAL